MEAETTRSRPQDRDPWHGYDHWRLGRVQVTRRAHLLLAAGPLLVPGISLLAGVALVAGGLVVDAALADESGIMWLPAALFGLGAAALLFGVSGLVSSLVVRLLAGRGAVEDQGAEAAGEAGSDKGEP